jgi:hypothetical protein
MFLNGLNDDIQFRLLNTDYADFQHLVDKAIVIENKIKEIRSGSNVSPHFSQPNQFFKPPQMNRSQMLMPQTKLSSTTPEHPDAEASTASTLTQCVATTSPEHAARPPP